MLLEVIFFSDTIVDKTFNPFWDASNLNLLGNTVNILAFNPFWDASMVYERIS